MSTPSSNRSDTASFVSTGHLPSPERVREMIAEAYEQVKENADGQNATVYPALATAPSDLFGICVVSNSGNIYSEGDAEYEFTIMSVSKPFVFALVCEALGPEAVRAKVSANATGMPFNSLEAIERNRLICPTNPMSSPVP